MNPYFTPSGAPGTRASLASSAIRAELASIAAAFDKLPTFTGNAGKAVVINGAETGLEASAGSYLLTTGGTISGNLTVTGNLAVSGNTTLGDAGADAVTINAATVTLVNSPLFTTTAGLLARFNSTAANGVYTEYANAGTVVGDIGTELQLTGAGSASNFGINARGARDLVLASNNTKAMTFPSSGNAWLYNATAPRLTLNVAGVGDRAFWEYDESATRMRLDSDGSIELRANNTTRFTIASAGGITFAGTMLPSADNTLDMGAVATRLAVVYSVAFVGGGSGLTALNATQLTSGTVPDARFPATLPALSGVNLTALNASNLASGTVATVRMGSGVADGTTYLRGDGTWATPSSGTTTNALTAGSGLTSGGTFNGAAARTFAVDSDTANTASKIVARDGSGNFAAGTITAALTGNASTATALQTARNINGTAFDGTGNITVTAAAGTLTGATLAAGVTASSLTSVGTLSTLTVSGAAAVGLASTVNGQAIGYRHVPINVQNANYTLVLGDAGYFMYHNQSGAGVTHTIPANASVAFPEGTVLTFVNDNGGTNLTIAITTDTMRLAGTGATGSRTLAANGRATALKVSSTAWQISGVGLT